MITALATVLQPPPRSCPVCCEGRPAGERGTQQPRPHKPRDVVTAERTATWRKEGRWRTSVMGKGSIPHQTTSLLFLSAPPLSSESLGLGMHHSLTNPTPSREMPFLWPPRETASPTSHRVDLWVMRVAQWKEIHRPGPGWAKRATFQLPLLCAWERTDLP